jgi:dienelactone hydrolase
MVSYAFSWCRLVGLVLALLVALNAACSLGAADQAVSAPSRAGGAAAARAQSEPPSALPATSTPLPAPTPLPTPTPTPHPLTIAAMRAREYPGSDLVIEQTLAPGSNYNRYIASYRSEGLKIYALLTVPRGQRPPRGWPVIIFNHGYIPPAQYRTTERYVAYVDAFARNGYIVLKPDYRGHGNSEGEARGAYSTPDYVVDVLNAVATMRRWPDADPERIGMWGHSMGGYITLRAMVIDPSIKAGVIWAGVVASYPDLLARWSRPPTGAAPPPAPPGRPPTWREQLIATYGSPEENPGFWASISANTYLADLSGPVQLHHGTADTSVPLEFSQILAEQIQAAGGVVEFYTYPGDDHNISRNLGVALSRSVAFFNKYVKEAR